MEGFVLNSSKLQFATFEDWLCNKGVKLFSMEFLKQLSLFESSSRFQFNLELDTNLS